MKEEDYVFKEKTASGITVVFKNAPDPTLFKKFQEEVISYNMQKYPSTSQKMILEELERLEIIR